MVADNLSIKTLLIVEDQGPTREALAAILRAEGFQVVTAANRQEALQHLRGPTPPQLVLLDMRPAVDSSGFLEERRHDIALASVPVVVVTELSTDREWVTSLGATDAVAKPVPLDSLLTILRRCGSSSGGVDT